jgi:alkanesulfonate monooxygenase
MTASIAGAAMARAATVMAHPISGDSIFVYQFDIQSARWEPEKELRLERRLFAGVTAWSPLDIFGAGSSAVYFVGDPEEIADNVKVYRDEAKLSALILSGWPLIEEAETVSQLLLPRLYEIR